MPEGETEVTTSPVAESTVETEADPKDGATQGIKDRLDRFERKLVKEKVQPLQTQLDAIRAKIEEQGLDIALFGFTEASPAPAEKQVPASSTNSPSGAEVELWRYKAAVENGLSQEFLPLITETSQDGIQKQVQAIKTLVPKNRRSPILPGPDGKPQTTFKRSQLNDGTFFEKHRDDIMKAMREGRIVNDL